MLKMETVKNTIQVWMLTLGVLGGIATYMTYDIEKVLMMMNYINLGTMGMIITCLILGRKEENE